MRRAPTACQSSGKGRDGFAHMRRFCAADYHRANAAAEAIRFVCAIFALRVRADEQSSRDVRRAQGGCGRAFRIARCHRANAATEASRFVCAGFALRAIQARFARGRVRMTKSPGSAPPMAPRAARFLIFPRRTSIMAACQPPISGSRTAIHAQAAARTKPAKRKPHCGRQRGAATDSASPRALSHSLRSMPICTASI